VSRWEPPLWFDRLGGVAWRGIAIVVAGVLLVAGIVGLSAVILPVVLGLLFTSVLRPLALWLRGRGVPNSIASALSVLALMIALVGVVWLTVKAVVDQWPQIEMLIAEARTTLADLAEDNGVSDETASTLEHGASDAVGEVVNLLFHGVIQLAPTIAALITAIILSLLVTFFFLKDGASMWRWIVVRFDPREGVVDQVGQRVWPVVTGYMLGQSAIAAIDASMIALGALILGVPNVGAIAVITFFGAFIPYIGALVAGFVAVMLAIADGGIGRGVAMLAVVILVQLIEGNILQPWIQGRAVKLHPLVVALSVAAGGALAGFLGVFLAVPITAAGFVALSELRAAGVLGPRVPSVDSDAITPPAS
jgi:predicted PurR-regulated permease PerM